MFTGIITHLGKIVNKSSNQLKIKTDDDLIKKLKTSDSISINGICLTVVNVGKDNFKVDIMPETMQKTNLQNIKVSDLVNLESPATPNSFLAGHLIQGHVDGVAKLKGIIKKGNSHILNFSIPQTLSRYIVEKGSIALNGISLTVIEAGKDYFTVGIIPYTWDKTMLHTLKLGDFVNIEVDILAKYIERLIRK